MPTRKPADPATSRAASRSKSALPRERVAAKAAVTRPAAKKVGAAKPARAKANAAPAAGAAVAREAGPVKSSKPKAKLVRDSFTMPQADFALVALLKDRALDFKRPTKKSELLRAGLQALVKLDDKALRAALDALTPLTPGRPKKND
jgi:hypothetical protein